MRLFSLACLLICQLAFGQPLAPVPGHKLQIVIIAVSTFNDPSYDNAALELGIQSSSQHLKTFFSQHFPNAVIKIIDQPSDTTSDALTRFLKGDFKNIASGNVTLLFVLSHGEYVPFPNPAYGNDLYIVTTDTNSKDVKTSALSLTEDVLDRISGLEDGTIVLAFIDTCHAGSAENYGLDLQGLDAELAGMKMMFMGASVSDQLTFQASFTEALVDIWDKTQPRGANAGGGSCTSPEQSPKLIRDQIAANLQAKHITLQPNEGYPKVLLPFRGSLCLESLSASRALVIVDNGSNDSMVARFTDTKGVIPTDDESVDQHDSAVLSLPQGKYNLEFIVANHVMEQSVVDLTTSPWDYENYGAPSPTQLGTTLLRASNEAVAAALPTKTVDGLLQRAYAAFVVGGDTGNAVKTKAMLEKSATYRYEHSVMGSNGALLGDANAAALAGNFRVSAVEFQKIAQQATAHPLAQRTAATQAYFASAAAGDIATAQHIRTEYSLTDKILCEGCINLEKSAEEKPTLDSIMKFKSQGALNLLTQPDQGIVGVTAQRSVH